MLKLDLQLFGGRGSRSSGRGGDSGLSSADILSTTSFVSAREGHEEMVDAVLGVFNDVNNEYGFVIDDIHMAQMSAKGQSAIAYYDGSNIGWNETFMNKKTLDKAYADCVKSGFHPKTGKRSPAEAVASHELGHALTAEVGKKMGGLNIDQASTRIVNEARKQTKHRGVVQMAKKISGYATHSNAEAIAEAFADVYCNGKKARKESHAIVNVMNSYLK